MFPAKLSSSSATFFILVFLLAFGIRSSVAEAKHMAGEPGGGRPSPALGSYGRIPLGFEANRGQADERVDFLARGAGYSIYLNGSSAAVALGRAGECAPGKLQKEGRAELGDSSLAKSCASSAGLQDVIRMTLVGAGTSNGASQGARGVGENELPGKVNYFLGSDPLRWRTNLPTYARVRYAGVYRGIDLVYYGNQSQLEYDFVVAPGVSPDAIRLSFVGQKGLRIGDDGGLVVEGASGSMTIRRPVVYQEKKGRREQIAGSFQLLSADAVGFVTGKYDHARALVIDPVLVYSTYLGGSGASGNGDRGNGIAVDAAGNAYVVGTTYSADFPVTLDAHQAVNLAAQAGHGSTVFVSKLNATGTALVYSTYLGGSGAAGGGDFGYGIALDAANNAYVTGATYSTDFPVTCDAFQASNPSLTAGATTGFVTRLNAAGNGLAYSTYLGGTGNQGTPAHGDVAQAIAVNATGNAYVTGYTWSSNFPVTNGAFQATFQGSASVSNAFVTELNTGGTGLAYSTFLGGSGSNGAGDYGNGIAIDKAGDAFVAGSTASANFPVTSGSLQAALKGSSNAFVTELNPAGTSEVYSTYLGGSGADSAQAIAVDSKGFAYVAGSTSSSDFPLTAGVLEGADVETNPYFLEWALAGFVSKLSQNGSALEYSTYLEGVSTSIAGLAVDGNGSAYVTGSAPTIGAGLFGGFQVTPYSFPAPSSGSSAFLVKLGPNATVLNYATWLGGNANDVGLAVAVDTAGNSYVTGAAFSKNFPVTGGALQRVNRALATKGSNGFVSKFQTASATNQVAYSNTPFTIGTSMSSSNGQISVTCYPDFSADSLQMSVVISLSTNAYGPPPTGQIAIYDNLNAYSITPYIVPVSGSSGSGGSYFFSDGFPSDTPLDVNFTATWAASYTGDSVYQPSGTSGSLSIQTCPAPTSSTALPGARRGAPKATVRVVPAGSYLHQSKVSEPKFSPEPLVLSADLKRPFAGSSVRSQSSPVCTAPLTPLTVTVRPVSASRIYGAANPNFGYTVAGLMNGDTVHVVPTTTALLTSPVGNYPVTVDVTGAALANYALTVAPATLVVLPARLDISAASVAMTYGQTPPQLTAYHLSGFVNGDTASVVSGAPVLSTTVTPTTPVGFYKIGVGVGTLTAQNYVFNIQSNGAGVVGVYKATLQVTANNVTITKGEAIPPLTYSITGFANGETATGVVTGSPVLTTPTGANLQAGRYYIVVTPGSLAAQNYYFKGVYGILTVLP